MLLAPVLFVIASSMKFVSGHGTAWCYQSQVTCNHTCPGPDVWGGVSQHCTGRSQSPVNIVTRKTLPDERLTPFVFTGYQDTFHGRLINTGHSVQLELPSSMRISGGGLPATYKTLQLHLHWGKDGGPGSEHSVDGEKFPMEMHIVHIKEEYDTLSQALHDSTGVAVLGFFFQESMSANKKFDPLINALKYIKQHTNSTMVKGVSLKMLIPPERNLTKYFRYSGSLTTPNCAESVIWSLFESTIPLSKKQLTAFNHVHFPNGKQMIRTFRPVQPLNGRQVFYSGGHVSPVSTVLLIMSALLSTGPSLHTAG